MLYPKNTETALSGELFRNPTSEYRGTPFWAWNCELEEAELLRQLEVLKQMGFGGAHMHVRTGMATPYLSDEHMALVKACAEKCRREDMLAWLYDEDRWPSGAAGGIVTKDKQYRARYLLLTVSPIADETPLACYDVCLDDRGCLTSGLCIDPAQDARGTKWYAYLQLGKESPWYNNQTYINTLDKEAMQRFIDVTYERYLETVGEDFGGLVPAIFTDEPQVFQKKVLSFATEKKDITLPWSDDLPETYKAACGLDLMAHLPEMIWELPNGAVSPARYHFHDHIAERFAQAFADQCGAWCGDHNLMLTGHMMAEQTLKNQTDYLGEAMRSYRSFQLPGIDMLCNNFEFTTAKQAQSAVHQYGRPGIMSELYGVTGWHFDFRGHKLQGDWQAALGVTVRVPHLAWVSMKGEAKRDYPASISYQSPWWQDYALVEDHFARVNTALTRGKPLVRVGVIHPIESYWLHFGPAEQTEGIRSQMDESFLNLTKWLLGGCQDFDFISESLLPDLCTQGSAPLQVGKMAYDTILVPGCETLRSSTLERLEAFAAAGGRLIFLGDAPKYENALPSDRGITLWNRAKHIEYRKEAILDALEPDRLVEIRREDGSRSDNLIYQLRQDGNDRWLFIAHSAIPYQRDVSQRQQLRIALTGTWALEEYDTQTGEVHPLNAAIVNGKTVLERELWDLDSLLLRCIPCTEAAAASVTPAEEAAHPLPVPHKVAYTLDEPNVYLLDKAEFALDGAPYRPAQELLRADNELRQELGWPLRMDEVAQPWVIAKVKPEHTVRLRFRVQCALTIPDVKLALEDADIADIRCNGTAVPNAIDGWFTDKSIQTVSLGTLPQGETVIEITLPFGQRTNVEWCYLLGQFGVRVCGEYRELIPLQEYLGFDNVVHQGLAHYGSNITYHIPVTTAGGKLRVTTPHYAGTAIRMELDGRQTYIAYPPYTAELPAEAGDHTLNLTLLGNRANCFGPVHLADPHYHWLGPNSWRTVGTNWTESYRLKELGILTAPQIEEIR